jgi:hypothetical protein
MWGQNEQTQGLSHKIGKMLVDLFYHYKDISPDFIADYLVQNNPKPTVRNDNLRLESGLKPTFVVMACERKERCYAGSNNLVGSSVCYDFVLMDGSKTVFAARLNSGLSKQLHGYSVLPGASLTVTDWDMIPLRHDPDEAIMNRLVMFIKGFTWTPAPSVNTFLLPEIDSANEWTTDCFQKARFDFAVVGQVAKQKCVRMFNWCLDKKTKDWGYAILQEIGVDYGYWIRHDSTKVMWKQQLADRKRAALAASATLPTTCTCKEHYDLRKCVLVLYPISTVCKKDIYDQVAERIGTDNIPSPEFDGFLPTHKRWACYWYYSVNIFSHRGCLRRPLPPCFVRKVRELYPEPAGVCYTGFKTARGAKHELELIPGSITNKRFRSGVYDYDSSSDSDSE